MAIITLKEPISFEWDKGNDQKNWIKHNVSGSEAEDAFYDNKRLILEDIKHSEKEVRYILFGKTKEKRMLFIVFTIRDTDKVRIISARDINRKEMILYEKAIDIT